MDETLIERPFGLGGGPAIVHRRDPDGYGSLCGRAGAKIEAVEGEPVSIRHGQAEVCEACAREQRRRQETDGGRARGARGGVAVRSTGVSPVATAFGDRVRYDAGTQRLELTRTAAVVFGGLAVLAGALAASAVAG